MALIRPALLAGVIYLYYVVAFPDGGGGALYHVMLPALIAGGCVGLWFLNKTLDLGSGMMKLGVELVFLAAVFGLVGFTMPQTSGKTPLSQIMDGARPTQSTVRRGFERIGLNPYSGLADIVVKAFRKG